MTIDPQQIRTEIDGLLGDLPSTIEDPGQQDIDTSHIEMIDTVGRRLEQAHQILVDALESVEKG